MAFPSTQEQMFQAGYAYLRWERCPACTLDVEVWSTPGKREILMEPMPGFESPAVKHLERCNIAPKTGAQERLPQADAPKPSPEPQRG